MAVVSHHLKNSSIFMLLLLKLAHAMLHLFAPAVALHT
jgi:hypothetical protein